jgi:hypothetical protein
MSKDSYHNRLSKFIAGQKPNNVRVSDVATKASTTKLCNCPNSEPGKITADIYAHQTGCHIRGRLKSGRYTVNTSAIPRRISDGCSLGVAIGGEDF